MTVWILLVYLVTLASFAPPLILAGYLLARGQIPLAANYLRFQAAYGGFLAALLMAFLALTLFPDQKVEVEVLFNTLFFLLYALILRTLARFLFEMTQRPWDGPGRLLVDGLVLAGFLLPLGIHAVVFHEPERALILRTVLNSGYFVLFLGGIGFLFLQTARRWKRLADDWKRTTLRGACVIFVLGLPLFVADSLWPVLQLERGWIPRGLNLQIVVVLAWNLFFTVRWFSFPLHDPGQELTGEPSPRVMELMTGREREIALLILRGRSNQDICEALGVKMGTTKNHVYNIFNKTGASSRKELRRMMLDP